MAERVTIHEVGPRDGLQNEATPVATADKIALVDHLAAAGLTEIEVTSFVSPKWVPQLADAAAVMAGIARRPGVRYAALTPNMRGFEAAMASGADAVAIFAAASEGFSRANINCSIAESFDRFAPILDAARARNIPVRGYVSCVTHCPFDGPTPPAQVADVAGRLYGMGVAEVSLGETLGRAQPGEVDAMLTAVCQAVPPLRLAGHFHDTGGGALAAVEVALSHGLRAFDAAAGGLGGCPYAPGAAGNLGTGRLVAALSRAGYATGVDPAALAEAEAFATGLRPVPA